jgi:putative ABC transport system permease protein
MVGIASARPGLLLRRPVAQTVEIARNASRRRLRSVLTIAGIAVGVLALTTLGSMAELANTQLAGGERFLSDHVLVQVANQAGGSRISPEQVARIRSVSGVGAAYATLTMPADAVPPALGSTESIVAFDDGEYARLAPKLPLAEGRGLRFGDRDVAVVGAGFAAQHHLSVGSVLTLPLPPDDGEVAALGVSRDFTVVGVWTRLLAAPDQWAQVSLDDASALVPGAAGSTIANGADVYGEPGADLERVARDIESTVPGLQAISPGQTERAFRSIGAIYTGLTTGSALVALLIGGLSVINTMLMAVSDRTREIGIKKAIGAPTGRIAGELLVESALLGAAGGLLGLLSGWVLTAALNGVTEGATNAQLFLLTPRLLVAVPIFAIGLAVLAGTLPALRAARLDAVAALRAQA